MATVAQSAEEGEAADPCFPQSQDRLRKADLMTAKSDIAVTSGPLRAISFGNPDDEPVERRADGTIYLRPKKSLGDYPVRLTDRLHHWARAEPNRIFMAERRHQWRLAGRSPTRIDDRHPAIGLGVAGAVSLGRQADRDFLRGNLIDHALIAFGALYAGIPFCPVSPAYSLVSKDYGKLSYLMKLLTPGLVFADDAGKFADALSANAPGATPRSRRRAARCRAATVTMLADLLATPENPGLDRDP